MSFVHLHVHSEYSLLDGACRIDGLVARAKALGAEACAFGDIDIPDHRQWDEERCAAAGLSCLLPLWGEGRAALAREGVGAGFRAVIKLVRLDCLDVSFLGRTLDEATLAAIQAIQQPTDLQILVSLSCTMCPELVTAAQRLAAANPHITAQAYDLNHFPALRDQYKVMSVPCLVVNHGQQVSFGKKSIAQLLDLLS